MSTINDIDRLTSRVYWPGAVNLSLEHARKNITQITWEMAEEVCPGSSCTWERDIPDSWIDGRCGPRIQFLPSVTRLYNRNDKCHRPPEGWWCYLDADHAGPCPTFPAMPDTRRPLTLPAHLWVCVGDDATGGVWRMAEWSQEDEHWTSTFGNPCQTFNCDLLEGHDLPHASYLQGEDEAIARQIMANDVIAEED